MGILNIRKAEREGARLVIGIAGISGSGKTYSALQVAWGLAKYDSSKVGFLDTENRRGSLYADALKDAQGNVHQFLIADLDAPFSPDRYRQAILEFQEAGVEVLVIDSVTHEWEGQGGCHDIAKPVGSNLKVAKWNDAKGAHKSFMNAMLQCDMHIIPTIRARQKVELKKGEGGKVEYIPLGVLPIQEENFMFEMTASLMMWNEGKEQEVLKCPQELRHILGRQEGYLTAEDGKALRDWVDGAKQQDKEVERARNMLRTTCEQGMAALQEAWASLPAKTRKAIGPKGCPEDLKASAQAFDDQRKEASAGGKDLADLNNSILGNGAQGEDEGTGNNGQQDA